MRWTQTIPLAYIFHVLLELYKILMLRRTRIYCGIPRISLLLDIKKLILETIMYSFAVRRLVTNRKPHQSLPSTRQAFPLIIYEDNGVEIEVEGKSMLLWSVWEYFAESLVCFVRVKHSSFGCNDCSHRQRKVKDFPRNSGNSN